MLIYFWDGIWFLGKRDNFLVVIRVFLDVSIVFGRGILVYAIVFRVNGCRYEKVFFLLSTHVYVYCVRAEGVISYCD